MKSVVAAVVVLVVIGLAPAPVSAQIASQVYFRVTVDVANVRETPSRSAAVLARVTRDTRLPVVGFAGEWFRVELRGRATFGPESGFVHRSVGLLEEEALEVVEPVETERAVPPAEERADGERPGDREPGPPVDAPAEPQRVNAPTQAVFTPDPPADDRRFGVGARLGGFTFGFGGSVRAWASPRVGVQAELSRYSVGVSGGGFSGSSSVTEIAPSVIFLLSEGNPDDDVIVRPYVLGGLDFYRATVSTTITGLGTESESQTNTGYHVVGGTELRFADYPALSLSLDVGYYSRAVPIPGVSVGGFAYGARLHWYF